MPYSQADDDEAYEKLAEVVRFTNEAQIRDVSEEGEQFRSSRSEYNENTEPFVCSVCGHSKTDRHSTRGRYCRQCSNGYMAYGAKIRRKSPPGTKVTMDEYREYRERQGLPVLASYKVSRGRPSTPDPTDITQMTYREFWKYVITTARERFDPDLTLLVRGKDLSSGSSLAGDIVMKFRIEEKGLFPLREGDRFDED